MYDEGYFGELFIQEPVPGVYPRFELVGFHDRRTTHSSMEAHVLDDEGNPMEGIEVVFYWPDAQEDTDLGPMAGVPQGMRPGRGVIGVTKEDGTTGFGMGRGGAYTPHQERAPHAMWIRGDKVNSALVWWLGWVRNTQYDRVEPIFQLVYEVPDVPEPEPVPEGLRIMLDDLEVALIATGAGLQQALKIVYNMIDMIDGGGDGNGQTPL